MDRPIAVFWFRRDLRLQDNQGLTRALESGLPVLPLFIFDSDILEDLEDRDDPRVHFIQQRLQFLHGELRALGSGLSVYHGSPVEVWKQVLDAFPVEAVYLNRDYEPYARDRDEAVRTLLASQSVAMHSFKDQVIFEGREVLKPDGGPYSVYTPYSKRWLARLEEDPIRMAKLPTDPNFLPESGEGPPALEQIGFRPSGVEFPEHEVSDQLIRHYAERRDFPAIEGTSRLGLHLRFGTIGIRMLASRARGLSGSFLNELIWREFYQMILFHAPHVVHRAFKPAYDHIPWRRDEEAFERWKAGTTGYPMVDAGMRQLAATGYMHNRVRMVVASFLTKHLLIDWRWGEAWFARKLLDFELASNNGGWQWASGSGCDAAPYFRIFNPQSQLEKFDPKKEYVQHWIPEYGGPEYPEPMVEHRMARQRALDTYKAVLQSR